MNTIRKARLLVVVIGNYNYMVFANQSSDKSATRNTELCAAVILGGKKPWFVEDTSSLGESCDELVPTPTCACVKVAATKSNKPIKNDFLELFTYTDYLCLSWIVFL